MIRIAIFASGAGSNARKIMEHFRDHSAVQVALVGCNNPAAGVIAVAKSFGVPVLPIDKEVFFRGGWIRPAVERHADQLDHPRRISLEDPGNTDRGLSPAHHQYTSCPASRLWRKGYVWQ